MHVLRFPTAQLCPYMSPTAGMALSSLDIAFGTVMQVVTDTTTLGDLVQSNQRVVMLFYDQWKTPTGYTIGSKVSTHQWVLHR